MWNRDGVVRVVLYIDTMVINTMCGFGKQLWLMQCILVGRYMTIQLRRNNRENTKHRNMKSFQVSALPCRKFCAVNKYKLFYYEISSLNRHTLLKVVIPC